MTITAPPEPTMLPTCPAWCRFEADHTWDSYDDDGLYYCGHAGPRFGWFFLGGQETSDGRLTLDCGAYELPDDLSAADLRRLARDAERAAQWLEAHSC